MDKPTRWYRANLTDGVNVLMSYSGPDVEALKVKAEEKLKFYKTWFPMGYTFHIEIHEEDFGPFA